MLLRTKGKSINIHSDEVKIVTRNKSNLNKDNVIIVDEIIQHLEGNFIQLTESNIEPQFDFTGVYGIKTLEHLDDGDIVVVSEDGNVNTLYRINANQNTLMATERCNSNCLMCSQPPKDRQDIPRLYDINSKLIKLIPKNCPELGISGGEPTLMGDLFFDLLKQINRELPETSVHILTNGRTFAWNSLAAKLSEFDTSKIMFGIPLYSDYYQEHDYIVQAKDAFHQTILGIHNLERYNQRVEIRIVLHKQSIPRLKKLSEYIYKNLPFVEHIAFMGLEFIGYTPYNIDKLWIDPYDYQEVLSDSVEYLSGKGLNVSIYNTPLCLLPKSSWEFARKSISDWKNDYMDECIKCSVKEQCGGFFAWNLKKPSDYIRAIV
jgi:His-Xaa-Ser system radical SAM maturase HxsC